MDEMRKEEFQTVLELVRAMVISSRGAEKTNDSINHMTETCERNESDLHKGETISGGSGEEFVRSSLRILLSEHGLTCRVLSRVCPVSENWLVAYMSGDVELSDLGSRDRIFLELFAALLTSGRESGCDARLRAVLESLNSVYGMDIHMIAGCTGIPETMIMEFMHDRHALSCKQKFELAVRVMYLSSVFEFPDFERMPQAV